MDKKGCVRNGEAPFSMSGGGLSMSLKWHKDKSRSLGCAWGRIFCSFGMSAPSAREEKRARRR